MTAYRDEGASGKDMERPGLKAALAALAKGEADVLLVTKLDRLSRSVRDIYFLAENVFRKTEKNEEKRPDLVSISEDINTTTPTGRAMLGMSAVFSQLEREQIGERTRNGLAEVKAQGRYLGKVPVGHKRDEAGRLVVDTTEANAIRRARRMKDGGASWAQVAAAFGWSVGQARTRA